MMQNRQPQIWRSTDVEEFRGFEYYRDGICESFMELVPEPEDGEWDFFGSVESLVVGSGRINRVVATAHRVLRTSIQISRAHDECFYVNFKTRGECQILQSGENVVIRPGDVGLFSSTIPFALEHRRKPDLAVASFMITHDALRSRLPRGLPMKPTLVSAHPTLGHLIRETAATLSCNAESLANGKTEKLFNMLVDLVAMTMAPDGHAKVDTIKTRSMALFHAIRTYVDKHHSKAELNVTQVAGVFGISIRYVQKLFAASGMAFSEYLLMRRLQSVASDLHASGKSHHAIATLAYAHGFTDPAHFHRAFRKHFGCTAGEWRRLGTGTC